MAKYRYIFADLQTDRVTCELPLYGTTFSRRIVKAGEFQGSFGLNTEGINNIDVVNGTAPGRTALYIERNDKLVWGGIVWSRTWQEQSKSFQYYGQEFVSYYHHSDIQKTAKWTQEDQRNIVIRLVRYSQDQYSNREMLIDIPPIYGDMRTDIIRRDVAFYDYDGWTFGKAMEYMAEYDEGLDYYIDVDYDNFGNFHRFLVCNNRVGASLDDTQLIFEYPGSIKNFWYPENASKGATTIHGIGKGEGGAAIRLIVGPTPDLISVGYPELVQHFTNKDIATYATLGEHMTAQLRKNKVPVISPTYEIEADRYPEFGSYQLGDHAKIVLDSVRFPEPLETVTRIVGWDVTPSQSGSSEKVKIITAGEEEEGA